MKEYAHIISLNVALALTEDLNYNAPDYSATLIDDNKEINASIIAKSSAIICGIPWANEVFRQVDDKIVLNWQVKEGESLRIGQIICYLKGRARTILTAERASLNFIQTLSSTATAVAEYKAKIKPYPTAISDTRKTIPGLRVAQKYAVLVGGGVNQRINLATGVLIKENHILAAGGVKQILELAAKQIPAQIPTQIEIENLAQFKEALTHNATAILLDNMSVAEVNDCVLYNQKFAQEHNKIQAMIEVSGNIDLNNVLQYAQTGVDRIAVGAITKNIKALDLSLRFDDSIY